jgi:hypothetical protein
MGYTPPWLMLKTTTPSAGIISLIPDGVTTDDFVIYSNASDTYPNIKLNGAGNTEFFLPSGGGYLIVKDGTTTILTLQYVSPDLIITGAVTDKNIYLKTGGTGLVKFGTRTAGGDTTSNGYITILDSAGNTVKLMTTA